MIQYTAAHLKVLESEGEEHQSIPLHFLLYKAFSVLEESSIHVAMHSIETPLSERLELLSQRASEGLSCAGG